MILRRKRISLLVGIALALIPFLGGCKEKKEKLEPNVVLIVIDTLRADHLPFLGYEKNTSPFLGEIASKNIVFENAFSASSWTSPSTASIYTSLYPFQHGVIMCFAPSRGNKIELNRIPDEIKTITEVLGENGYATYGVSENINIGEEENFTQGFDRFEKFAYPKNKINQQLMDWSEEMKSKNKYFLYIHYNDPHKPYFKRSPWYEKKEDPRDNLISRYDSEINYVDEKIKQLYEFFEWDRNTLLVVTSDHGEEFWEHDGQGHGGTLYSEVIHIPFIVQLPEEERIRKRIPENVSNMDILPTIREFLGIKSNEVEEGMNLMPLIRGKRKYNSGRYIFSHLDRIRRQQEDLKFAGVISKQWKLIIRMKGGREFFNLKEDPMEKHNVYEENFEIAGLLLTEFMEFEKNCKKFSPKSTNVMLGE